MKWNRIGFWIRTLLVVMSFALVTGGENAWARAGGKRSFGQRSHPTVQPRSPNPPPSYQQPAQPTPPSSGRGSFMKGLAGGIAGGFLGSMLFSSLGHAAGFGGAGAGGIGFFDIILIAGLAYVAWRLWKSRQNRVNNNFMARPSMATSGGYGSSAADGGYFGQGSSLYTAPTSRIDRETVEDIFFRVQGAWTRRDLSSVLDYLDRDVARILEADIQDLKARREINRLENIAVRQVEISEAWLEGDRELVRVRFTANLLDYTVDESTGAIKDGSSSEPVKFDEYWIFAKSQGRSSWQLAGIEQI